MIEPLLSWCTRRLMKPFGEDWVRFADPRRAPLNTIRPFDLDARHFLDLNEAWCVPVIPFMNGGQHPQILDEVLCRMRAHPILDELVGTVLLLSRALHDAPTHQRFRTASRQQLETDGDSECQKTLKRLLRRQLKHRFERLDLIWMLRIEELGTEELVTLIEALTQIPNFTGLGHADPILSWMAIPSEPRAV